MSYVDISNELRTQLLAVDRLTKEIADSNANSLRETELRHFYEDKNFKMMKKM